MENVGALRLADAVRRGLRELAPGERDTAIAVLRDIIYQDAYEQAVGGDVPDACVRCGSLLVVKKGRDVDGSQRFACKDCGRTFGVKTGRVIASSKLAPTVWMQFIECFVDVLSLRDCASRCGVGLKTAFLMRRRILECVSRYLPSFRARAGQRVELDETFFRESFKGNHTRSNVFVMPRDTHRRGGSLSKRGLSKQQICVMSGAGTGAAFLAVAGRGAVTAAMVREILPERIGRGAEVATDKAHAYKLVLPDLGAIHQPTTAKQVNRVNALHSAVKRFLGRFNGVATKHLQSYLDWYIWRSLFVGEGVQGLARQLTHGVYRRKTASWAGVEPLYMEYWKV